MPGAESLVSLGAEAAERLRSGAVSVPAPASAWSVTGPGVLACLQGLVTADLDRAAEGAVRYGAFLTPKGMIVSDAWFLRQAGAIHLVAPTAAAGALEAIFGRMLPPRLARAAPWPAETVVRMLVGGGAAALAPVGRGLAEGAGMADEGLLVMRGPGTAPFTVMAVGTPARVAEVAAGWEAAGAMEGDDALRQAWRVLRGWPAPGAEIGERTLPQEVRFDEHDGVSYEKGCYTGQETVARLHFRGHANRTLRGLRLPAGTPPIAATVESGGKPVGEIHSAVALPRQTLALCVLRREVATGDQVEVGGVPARVEALPFPEGTG